MEDKNTTRILSDLSSKQASLILELEKTKAVLNQIYEKLDVDNYKMDTMEDKIQTGAYLTYQLEDLYQLASVSLDYVNKLIPECDKLCDDLDKLSLEMKKQEENK